MEKVILTNLYYDFKRTRTAEADTHKIQTNKQTYIQTYIHTNNSFHISFISPTETKHSDIGLLGQKVKSILTDHGKVSCVGKHLKLTSEQ